MKNYKVIILGILLLSSLSIYSEEYRGSDITPKQIKSKYYVWSKKTQEPTSDKNPANIWFNSYSNEMNGYVILNNGERIKGKITVRNRWNLASTKKLTEKYTTSTGETATRKVPNPEGVNVMLEIHIVNDTLDKTISTEDIKNYGPYFTMADWALVKGQKSNADKFLQGSYEDMDGNKKDGFLTLNTYSYWKRKFDLRYYDLVFYAENESANAELMYAKDLKQVTQSSILYTNYRKRYLIDRDLLISTLETNAKKLSQEDLVPGSVVTIDGEEIKGRIAAKKEKFITSTGGSTTVMGKEVVKVPSSNNIIFISNNKDVHYYGANNAEIMYYVVDGVEHYAVEGKFVGRDMLNLEKGKMVYKDGSEKEGELTYRNNYFLYDDGSGKLTPITAAKSDNLDYVVLGKEDSLRKVLLVEEKINGKPTKYFIEIMYPFKKYSYYKNPNPTHERSGASLATNLGVIVAGTYAEQKLKDEGAEETESEGDIGDVDIDIYYREWVVIINKTGEKVVVYKKNIDREKSLLLGTCQRMSVNNRKKISDISKVNEVDLLVRTLNECADQD